VARGETTVSISFVHDGPGEKRCRASRWPPSRPAEGTGAEIGSMSIIKGARNLDNAKKFYEWALTGRPQEMGAAAKQFQVPSNKAAKVDERVPDFKKIKFINYDYAKYGASAERQAPDRQVGKGRQFAAPLIWSRGRPPNAAIRRLAAAGAGGLCAVALVRNPGH
jgi:ABC-type Fe3+ transport system substrate-binding protein